MKILYATYPSAEDFLSHLEVGEETGGGRLSVPTKARYKPGEALILEIGFPGLPNRVLVRCTCVSSPEEGKGDEVFELLQGEEHKRDFLVAIAAGRANASWQRKSRRFPIRLPARFIAEGEEIPLRGDAETDDVSSSGVFLKTSRSLPEGSRVTIVLDPCDGSAEMEFTGHVVYSRKDDAQAGFGVQFDRLNSDERKRLRRLIRDVKLRGRVVEWEDASGSV